MHPRLPHTDQCMLDKCHTNTTLHDMNVLMDADCLIKLTKAQLKEEVCAAFDVTVPARVIEEVMVAPDQHPECAVIQRNLERGLLAGLPDAKHHARGDEALLAVSGDSGEFAAIASDDKRFIRQLRLLGKPYLTPAVMVLWMVKHGRLQADAGLAALVRLAPMISDAEVALVRIRLQSMPEGGG